MAYAGGTSVLTLLVPDYDNTTQASVVVTNDHTGPLSLVAPATADGGKNWTVPVPWPRGGVYRALWTVVGTGANDIVQTIRVQTNTDPVPVEGRLPFADTAALADYIGPDQTVPQDAVRQLRNATREIERMTQTACYAVDDDGLPTDPKIKLALQEATCELVWWWQQTADPDGARSAYSWVAMGSMALGAAGGKASGGKSGGATRIGEQVYTILTTAGLLTEGPRYR